MEKNILPAKVFIALSGLTFFYALMLDCRGRKQAQRLELWTRRFFPDVWRGLPWIKRELIPESGLRDVNRRDLIQDEDFREMFKSMERVKLKEQFMLLLGLALLTWTVCFDSGLRCPVPAEQTVYSISR